MARARVTALLGVALAITAALFDAEPLWVPAVVLVTVAGVAVAWVSAAARGLGVQRTLAARRVVEGEPLAVQIRVRGGRIALPPAVVRDPLLRDSAPLPGGRRGGRVRIQVRFGRRGRRVLPPSTVELADPLGLAGRVVSAAPDRQADEVLVLPRVEPVTGVASGSGTLPRWLTSDPRRPVAALTDIDGVGPLRPGTPASRIYWPAIARGADPLERRLATGADGRPLILLDASRPASPEDLDAAVRATASLARWLAARGGVAVLLPGDRRASTLDPGLAGWDDVHARLAVVAETAAPPLSRVRGTRLLFVVSARRRTAPPPGFASAGAETVLVVPGGLVGRTAVFGVAGCHGYRVGGSRATRVVA